MYCAALRCRFTDCVPPPTFFSGQRKPLSFSPLPPVPRHFSSYTGIFIFVDSTNRYRKLSKLASRLLSVRVQSLWIPTAK